VPESGPPQPVYADIAFARGVIAQRPYTGGEWKPSTAWHAQFEDVNNDGLADLFIAKGNVAKMPDFAHRARRGHGGFQP
jgi:enediyne biosynthesis protein E4